LVRSTERSSRRSKTYEITDDDDFEKERQRRRQEREERRRKEREELEYDLISFSAKN